MNIFRALKYKQACVFASLLILYLCDGAAADDEIPVIQNNCLPRGDGSLRPIEYHLGLAALHGIDGGRLRGVAVAHLGVGAYGGLKGFKGEKIPVFGNELCRKQQFFRAYSYGVCLHILMANIHRLTHGKTQTLALT